MHNDDDDNDDDRILTVGNLQSDLYPFFKGTILLRRRHLVGLPLSFEVGIQVDTRTVRRDGRITRMFLRVPSVHIRAHTTPLSILIYKYRSNPNPPVHLYSRIFFHEYYVFPLFGCDPKELTRPINLWACHRWVFAASLGSSDDWSPSAPLDPPLRSRGFLVHNN